MRMPEVAERTEELSNDHWGFPPIDDDDFSDWEPDDSRPPRKITPLDKVRNIEEFDRTVESITSEVASRVDASVSIRFVGTVSQLDAPTVFCYQIDCTTEEQREKVILMLQNRGMDQVQLTDLEIS